MAKKFGGKFSPDGQGGASVREAVVDARKVDAAGPFSKAAMGRMAAEGALTRTSMVWTQGQDGWKSADEVDELAQLFTVMPPPPPGA
jgi:hypothetical protein